MNVTEAILPNHETHEDEHLDALLESLGERIREFTAGNSDVPLNGANSKRVVLNDDSKLALIYFKEGRAGIGPEVMIQKEGIETVGETAVLKRYSLRWSKEYPDSKKDQVLTIINPAAKKDIRREIRGYSLNQYSKDMEVALRLAKEADEVLGSSDG